MVSYGFGGIERRVALVTGAGSGIGAASAAALARAGGRVAVTDIDYDSAHEVAVRITESGGEAIAIALDVSQEDHWTDALSTVTDHFGAPVTALHNNASITGPDQMGKDLDVTTADPDLWDTVMGVSLKGSMLGCKHVIPGMVSNGGGAIINTSSIKGLTGSIHRVAYASAKGGLNTLTKMVASSHGKYNIRCNAVAPGIIETPTMCETIPPEQKKQLLDAHLIPRLGSDDDIANVVVFLAGTGGAWITGQVLTVDGGLSVHTPALSPRIV